MDLNKNSHDRRLSEPFTCRYWEDNYERLISISEETRRKPNEVARDLMDYALRHYLSGPATSAGDNSEIMQKLDQLIEQNRLATERHEQLVRKYEQLEEQNADLRRGLIQNLREFYGVLLETLSAAIGARLVAWKYVAYTVLKQGGYNDEQINERYRAEKKAWIEEKERIVRLLDEGISRMPPPE